MSAMRVRTYKAPDEVYDPALAAAERAGVSLGDVIRDALRAFVKKEAKAAARAANEASPA